jgi:hypothetical protein
MLAVVGKLTGDQVVVQFGSEHLRGTFRWGGSVFHFGEKLHCGIMGTEKYVRQSARISHPVLQDGCARLGIRLGLGQLRCQAQPHAN